MKALKLFHSMRHTSSHASHFHRKLGYLRNLITRFKAELCKQTEGSSFHACSLLIHKDFHGLLTLGKCNFRQIFVSVTRLWGSLGLVNGFRSRCSNAAEYQLWMSSRNCFLIKRASKLSHSNWGVFFIRCNRKWQELSRQHQEEWKRHEEGERVRESSSSYSKSN